ncbi:MAG: phosphoheptose isomerase [Planctomycetes bacterium RBG_16_64_10]|nr:MAG: phosphoheptose isomerase [Planctomycetes bacterium RBG_16_64_10]
MTDREFTTHYLADLAGLLPRLDAGKVAEAIQSMRVARDAGRMIYICGNGGSASIASQMVVDIVKGASFKKKARFKMIGLTDSMATITAYANDEGYDTVFVEPLKNFAAAGDLLLAISGSGNSPNVLRAVEYANRIGCQTIGLTTGEGGQLKDLVDLPLLVPSRHMGRLEDCFFILTHILCYAFMEAD